MTTTDPTAGERCSTPGPDSDRACHKDSGHTGEHEALTERGEIRWHTPAEPDAGDARESNPHDVAALASSLYRRTDLNLALADPLDIDCHDVARAVLASDWLDAVRRKAGDERAEQIAQAIEAAGIKAHPGRLGGACQSTRHRALTSWPCSEMSAYTNAARIAREVVSDESNRDREGARDDVCPGDCDKPLSQHPPGPPCPPPPPPGRPHG